MSIGTWNPDESNELDAQVLGDLLAAAAQLDAPEFGLDADQVGRLAAFARVSDAWTGAIDGLEDAQLVALIRLYTLAEARFPSWEGGAKSPVIAMARALKARSAYPDDLTAWIKANSDNRFLPHGSLMDRL